MTGHKVVNALRTALGGSLMIFTPFLNTDSLISLVSPNEFRGAINPKQRRPASLSSW